MQRREDGTTDQRARLADNARTMATYAARLGDSDRMQRYLDAAEALETGEAMTLAGWQVGRPDDALVRLGTDDSLTPVEPNRPVGGAPRPPESA